MDYNSKLNLISEGLSYLAPELILLTGIVLLLLLSLLQSVHRLVSLSLTIVILIATLFSVVNSNISTDLFFFYSLRLTAAAVAFKLIIIIATLISVSMTWLKNEKAEFYLLLLSAVLGASLLTMSTHLVMILISLEMISICSYVLVAGMDASRPRSEAAWKFFVFGSAATAVMIFGMSYIYGSTGNMILVQPGEVSNGSMLVTGVLMMIAGLLFKVTAVPFHLWAPDVYEASPSYLVAFFSIVPKMASVASIITVFFAFAEIIDMSVILGVLAVASLILGNLGALGQSDARRLMAWSSVAQAGFLLAGLALLPAAMGIPIIIFYAVVLMVMNFVVFLVIQLGEENLNSTAISAFAGWGSVAIFPALAATIGLVSLIGLPPVGGFMAKFFVFSALLERYQQAGQSIFLVLFVISVLMTVISLFFYLKIPFQFFLRPSADGAEIKSSLVTNLLLLILVVLLLVLFFQPGLLMGWANKATFVL